MGASWTQLGASRVALGRSLAISGRLWSIVATLWPSLTTPGCSWLLSGRAQPQLAALRHPVRRIVVAGLALDWRHVRGHSQEIWGTPSGTWRAAVSIEIFTATSGTPKIIMGTKNDSW